MKFCGEGIYSSCCLLLTWMKKGSEHPEQSGIQGTPVSVSLHAQCSHLEVLHQMNLAPLPLVPEAQVKSPAVGVVSNVGPLDWAVDFSCVDRKKVLPARPFITNYCQARD